VCGFTYYTTCVPLYTLHYMCAALHTTLHVCRFTYYTTCVRLYILHYMCAALHTTLHVCGFTYYTTYVPLYILHYMCAALHTTLHVCGFTYYTTCVRRYILHYMCAALHTTLHVCRFTYYTTCVPLYIPAPHTCTTYLYACLVARTRAQTRYCRGAYLTRVRRGFCVCRRQPGVIFTAYASFLFPFLPISLSFCAQTQNDQKETSEATPGEPTSCFTYVHQAHIFRYIHQAQTHTYTYIHEGHTHSYVHEANTHIHTHTPWKQLPGSRPHGLLDSHPAEIMYGNPVCAPVCAFVYMCVRVFAGAYLPLWLRYACQFHVKYAHVRA
jgi:hypothetical protein